MKCNIIRDLMPMYMEGLTSNESNKAILSHIAECEDCHKIFEEMNEAIETKPIIYDKESVEPLRKIHKRTKLMKRIITGCVVCIILLLIYTGYSMKYRGITCFANRSIEKSSHYSKSEIVSAMDLVQKKFKFDFGGCVLTKLEYADDYSEGVEKEWANQYNADEAIVLTSSFKVFSWGGDGSLYQGDTYQDWEWILTRDDGEEWQLQTWGY